MTDSHVLYETIEFRFAASLTKRRALCRRHRQEETVVVIIIPVSGADNAIGADSGADISIDAVSFVVTDKKTLEVVFVVAVVYV